MTPEQAHRLEDLFMVARQTTRATTGHFLTARERKQAHAADDAAVKAFMDAVAEMVEVTK